MNHLDRNRWSECPDWDLEWESQGHSFSEYCNCKQCTKTKNKYNALRKFEARRNRIWDERRHMSELIRKHADLDKPHVVPKTPDITEYVFQFIHMLIGIFTVTYEDTYDDDEPQLMRVVHDQPHRQAVCFYSLGNSFRNPACRALWESVCGYKRKYCYKQMWWDLDEYVERLLEDGHELTDWNLPRSLYVVTVCAQNRLAECRKRQASILASTLRKRPAAVRSIFRERDSVFVLDNGSDPTTACLWYHACVAKQVALMDKDLESDLADVYKWHERLMSIKEDIIAAALRPSRVDRLIKEHGLDVLEHV